MLTTMEGIYPQAYVDATRVHTTNLLANITTARKIVMTLLFYNGGSFNTASNINNMCTFAGCAAYLKSVYSGFSLPSPVMDSSFMFR
ncbi:MAG: hypothetical protein J6O00_03860 [Clostridiales bacterium]|nr:hypothetical protein [Clostridiales bacterium]